MALQQFRSAAMRVPEILARWLSFCSTPARQRAGRSEALACVRFMPRQMHTRIAERRAAWSWRLTLDSGGGPMRRYVTENELLEVLNLRLEAAGMPADFRFHEPIRPLSYQDADGCNWTRLVAISNIHLYPPIYRQVASLIVSEVAREYSVLGVMRPMSVAR